MAANQHDASEQLKGPCVAAEPTSAPQVKHDWYQTDSTVVISVLGKGLNLENLKVTIQKNEVTVAIPQPDSSERVIEFKLSNPIVPKQSSYKIFSTKVEIKLKKRDDLRWTALEGDATEQGIPAPRLAGVETTASTNPLFNKWDKVAADLNKDLESEKKEGEDSLNALFAQIYGEGSDEVKKAMNKSFLESGGTVLSTNWKDVQEKKVDVKPPDGMEWRKWDQ